MTQFPTSESPDIDLSEKLAAAADELSGIIESGAVSSPRLAAAKEHLSAALREIDCDPAGAFGIPHTGTYSRMRIHGALEAALRSLFLVSERARGAVRRHSRGAWEELALLARELGVEHEPGDPAFLTPREADDQLREF